MHSEVGAPSNQGVLRQEEQGNKSTIDDEGIRWAGQFRLVCCVMLQSSGDNFSVTGQRKYAIAEHCVLSLE